MIADDPIIVHLHCAWCGRPMVREARDLAAPLCSLACETAERQAREAQRDGETQEKLRRIGALYRMRFGRRKDDPLRRALEEIERAAVRIERYIREHEDLDGDRELVGYGGGA